MMIHLKSVWIAVLLVFCTVTITLAQSSSLYTPPQNLGDGWVTSDLSSSGIDTARISKMFKWIQDEPNKLHSMLVVKNGELVVEGYFKGETADKPHDLRSVTKRIRSLLLGIAIDQGFIQSVNDPALNYLKDKSPQKNEDPRKDEITIRHLLTMSSGLDCNDWDRKSKGQEDRVYRKRDWIQYTLDLPMINDPGEVSAYCSMGTVLLAEIISQASGLTIQEFADEYLFEPLGISNAEWGHTSNRNVIPSAKRLYLTSRDMAKIGQLILNQGSWNGQQIVSSEWISEATTPKTKITGIDYGFLWWNIPHQINDRVVISKTATGNGGQYIMVIPEMDLVAVFTGEAYNDPQEDKLPFAIMNQLFLPLFDN